MPTRLADGLGLKELPPVPKHRSPHYLVPPPTDRAGRQFGLLFSCGLRWMSRAAPWFGNSGIRGFGGLVQTKPQYRVAKMCCQHPTVKKMCQVSTKDAAHPESPGTTAETGVCR